MDFNWYSISLNMVTQWLLAGFACTFFLRDVQAKFAKENVNIKAALVIATSLSILLLFLLIGGYNTTIIALLSFGSGVIVHLAILALMKNLIHFFSIGKTKPHHMRR